MASVIYHFLNNKKMPERIRKAKKFERFARDLTQIEVLYAPLHLPASDEQEITHASVELFEGEELLLRMEVEDLQLNPNEQELVARCETLEMDDGEGIHVHVPGLLRANEFILSPQAEVLLNPKKEAIAYLLHQAIFNGYFTTLIVNEQIMRRMSVSWQEVWRDYCFERTLQVGEDTYWRANDPSEPVLA